MLELRQLAVNLSSSDILVAMEARRELARFMAPEHLVHIWRQNEQDALIALLHEAEAVGNYDVYAALGDGFKRLFDTGGDKANAEVFLLLDKTHVAARFLVDGVSHVDITRAANMRPALLGLMAIVPPELAPRVGELLSATLKNERVLRLFDENRPESAENKTVCKFLAEHTNLISFITSSTVDAFERDPLLVANYITVSGIISRHMELPRYLSERIERSLTECNNEFEFCFVCRACGTAFRNHESNASKYMTLWGVAAARHLAQCSNDARGAIYGILSAASTTASGWKIVQSCVPIVEEMMRSLGISSLHEEVLDLMGELVRSPHVTGSLFGPTLLRAAWQLHNNVNDAVREKLWNFLNCGFARENIMLSLAPTCASFLCSFPQENCVNCRELQLQVSAHLMDKAGLSPEVTGRLGQFCARGLYPLAPVGVGAMAGR